MDNLPKVIDTVCQLKPTAVSNAMKSRQGKTAFGSGDKDRAERILDSIDANVVVLDGDGVITATNKAWRDFSANNPLPDGSPPRRVDVGTNYLQVCRKATGRSSDDAMLIHKGISAVLTGKKRSFSHEYPCHSSNEKRWFVMRVKRISRSNPTEVVITHFDITECRLAEMALRDKQNELDSALLKLLTLADSIKASLLDRSEQKRAGGQLGFAPVSELLARLSKREMNVLTGLVRGERNSAIAERLKLSPKSISTYRSRIFEKLRIKDNIQLGALMSDAEFLAELID